MKSHRQGRTICHSRKRNSRKRNILRFIQYVGI